MTNIVERNENHVQRYDTGDPFAAFANEGGPGIQGKLLQCKKGTWGIGPDGAPVPAGARFLVNIPSMMRGWMRWQGGVVTDAKMGLVAEGFVTPHRYSLGDLDEDAWETLPDGTARDPWAQSYRVLMIEVSPPHGDVTFAGSSYGTALCLKELCRVYSLDAPRHPEAQPVVSLATKTRQSKQWGPIVGPWFEVQGWATVADVRAGRKAKAAAKKVEAQPVEAKPLAAELDDAIPTWS